MGSIGCQVEEAAEESYFGIKVVPGPEIVLKPSFVVCPSEYKKRFPTPQNVKISKSSSLVVNGSGVVIESLDLDGALVIDCEEGATGVIRDLVVRNKGWEKVIGVSSAPEEYIRIRGYRMNKVETEKIVFKKEDEDTAENVPAPQAAHKSRGFEDPTDLSTPLLTDEEAETQSQQGCCDACTVM